LWAKSRLNYSDGYKLSASATNRLVHLGIDDSSLQTKDNGPCSNEKNPKPIPRSWSFAEEHDRKDGNEHNGKKLQEVNRQRG
jgi:hypothetical protein